MNSLLSLYKPSFLKSIVYMFQQSEYRSSIYLRWLWRTKNFSKIENRGSIDLTIAAKGALLSALLIELTLFVFFGYLAYFYVWVETNDVLAFISLLGIFLMPVLVSHLLVIPVKLGKMLVINPAAKRRNARAARIFRESKATKIAIAGSYGKTTLKETLATVLSEGFEVKYTEGNLNTAIAHSWLADKLNGKEDVIVVEYGEYRPGDIAEFNEVVQPNIGIITGLNEAHLDNFKTLEVSADNLLSLREYVDEGNYYLNGDSDKLMHYIGGNIHTYNSQEVDGWKISDIKISVDSTKFTMRKGRRVINADSSLVGRHNIGVLALSVVIADRLGLNKKQIEAGLRKTMSFEHRLKTEVRQDGVTIIDDTYNGNIDGIKVGTEFLGEIKADRKVYVTPGLVEQGKKTKEIHIQMGEYIALVADVVVLMQNSVTDHIVKGLRNKGFKGDLIMIDEPLKFYKNLNQFTAAGDVVLMQNDWPDLYA